jgi:hypothetical protein
MRKAPMTTSAGGDGIARENRDTKNAGEDTRASVAYDSSGGCRLTLTHKRQAMTMSSLFNFKANTVARPHGVSAMTCMPSPDQAKCSRQACRRGRNTGARSPVSGSSPSIWMPLCWLHRRQDNYKLSSVSDLSKPSSIVDNGTNVYLKFGTRATVEGVTTGSITCDETVLSRPTTVCP